LQLLDAENDGRDRSFPHIQSPARLGFLWKCSLREAKYRSALELPLRLIALTKRPHVAMRSYQTQLGTWAPSQGAGTQIAGHGICLAKPRSPCMELSIKMRVIADTSGKS